MPKVVAYEKGGYGWWVVVPEMRDEEDVPSDLQDCLLVARALDCNWVMFDCDAGASPLLRMYSEES